MPPPSGAGASCVRGIAGTRGFAGFVARGVGTSGGTGGVGVGGSWPSARPEMVIRARTAQVSARSMVFSSIRQTEFFDAVHDRVETRVEPLAHRGLGILCGQGEPKRRRVELEGFDLGRANRRPSRRRWAASTGRARERASWSPITIAAAATPIGRPTRSLERHRIARTRRSRSDRIAASAGSGALVLIASSVRRERSSSARHDAHSATCAARLLRAVGGRLSVDEGAQLRRIHVTPHDPPPRASARRASARPEPFVPGRSTS